MAHLNKLTPDVTLEMSFQTEMRIWEPGSPFLSSHTRIIYGIIQIITYFLVRSLYDYKEIIYDPRMNTKNHTSIFHKFLFIYVF